MAITQAHTEGMLDSVIADYAARGYRVITRTPTSAQLVKPKTFSFGWALFWLLMLGFGLLVYIFYYASKRDQLVYLRIEGQSILAREEGRPELVVDGSVKAERAASYWA